MVFMGESEWRFDVDRWRERMDPKTEQRNQHSAHVFSWKLWYMTEGKHFDNGRRHAGNQLIDPPINAQCSPRKEAP